MGRASRARGSRGDRARDVREDVSEAVLFEPFRRSLLKGWEWSRMGKRPIRQEKEHVQRACGTKACLVSEGQEGSPGDE